MKKTLLTLVTVLVLVSVCLFALTACDEETETATVVDYQIEDSKVDIGDTFKAPTITAIMSDETTKTVTNNLVYSEEDLKKLKLDDDNKYTQSGTYDVRVYIIDEREEFLLDTWHITVRVKK